MMEFQLISSQLIFGNPADCPSFFRQVAAKSSLRAAYSSLHLGVELRSHGNAPGSTLPSQGGKKQFFFGTNFQILKNTTLDGIFGQQPLPRK